MRFTIDSPQPLLNALRSCKIQRDPRYLGELQRFYDSPGIRKTYFRREGLTVDDIGEKLWSDGLLTERPTEREVLDLLEELFSAVSRVPARHDSEVDGAALEVAFHKAQRNRWRRWTCPSGCSSVRASKLDLRVSCAVCGDPLTRVDATPAEITLSSSVAVGF